MTLSKWNFRDVLVDQIVLEWCVHACGAGGEQCSGCLQGLACAAERADLAVTEVEGLRVQGSQGPGSEHAELASLVSRGRGRGRGGGCRRLPVVVASAVASCGSDTAPGSRVPAAHTPEAGWLGRRAEG